VTKPLHGQNVLVIGRRSGLAGAMVLAATLSSPPDAAH
jgi:hypothetical protein